MCAVALKRGAVAPFAGQLLTPDLALRLAQTADGCDGRIATAENRCHDDAKIDLDKEKALHEADNAAFQQQLLGMQEQLARAQKVAQEDAPPFFKQPWFVAPVTAVITAGVVVWALHH